VSAPLLPSLIGPTASGKTAVAIDAARRAGLEILSADSRQVYRGLVVGTAQPTPAERARAPHHLVGHVEPTETYSAARFGRDARAVAEEVRARGGIPFLVGGSGLYLRAAEEGLFEGPSADPILRAELEAFADREGNEALHARLAAVDPEAASRLPAADRVRVVRAIEVHELTGVALSEHHRRHRDRAPAFRALRFGLAWGREALGRRIARRVDAMLAGGWIEEVEALRARGVPDDAPAFDALGYPEVLAHLRREFDRNELRERVIVATRRFAKRQRTWFRAVPDVRWFEVRRAADLEGIGAEIAEGIRRAEAEAGPGAGARGDDDPGAAPRLEST
jgi:tRNA dimethylallyltransferase